MTATNCGDCVRLGYVGAGAQLELRAIQSDAVYRHDWLDEYWKIGITLPDIDIAYSNLVKAGIQVSEPQQFKDVGYMCHLTDPQGYCIELLQHTFAGEQRTAEGDASLKLGGGAQVGQITLRTTNIESSLACYQNEMGMRVLSVQNVEGMDFELYFLAFTDEEVPNNDLYTAANRPWLYQRPYTTLELQYLTNPTGPLRVVMDGEPGYEGVMIE